MVYNRVFWLPQLQFYVYFKFTHLTIFAGENDNEHIYTNCDSTGYLRASTRDSHTTCREHTFKGQL